MADPAHAGEHSCDKYQVDAERDQQRDQHLSPAISRSRCAAPLGHGTANPMLIGASLEIRGRAVREACWVSFTSTEFDGSLFHPKGHADATSPAVGEDARGPEWAR
jgi:hypothetical protein